MKYIFLISGKLQSGKNQFAEYVSEHLSYNDIRVTEDLFAKGVKDGCKEDFKKFTDCLNDKLYNIEQMVYNLGGHDLIMNDTISAIHDLKIYDDNWYENKTDLTRVLLQTYGTEIFRDRVDQEYWPKQLCERCESSDSDVILITDVRFENEVSMLKDLGRNNLDIQVVSIRIEREMERANDFNEHPSETALDEYDKWDYVVTNNDSLEMLQSCALEIANEIYFEED